jgi:aminoglycoside 6'-N-acetyltransferase I
LTPLPPFPVDVAEFDPADEMRLNEAASVLYRAASRFTSAFPAPEAALGELIELTRHPGSLMFVALNLGGEVCGLAAASPRAASSVLVIRALTVDPPFQRRGVGRALLRRLETAALRSGFTTMTIALEDEAGLTSLAGRSLFPDPLAPMTRFIPPAAHPSAFLKRLGFALSGVIPEAAGPGRPELWFAKPLISPES